jgi:cytochrome b6-f complex iron-sulfur subunit
MASRREFIKKALTGLLALLGFGSLFPIIRILSPVNKKNKDFVFFPLMPEEEIPRSGVKKVELTYAVSGKDRKARVFIVSSLRGMTILSATCSHLGCLVNYHKERREFICPCHGGRYNLAGEPVAGPPPAPLNSLPFKLDKGMVLIGIKV